MIIAQLRYFDGAQNVLDELHRREDGSLYILEHPERSVVEITEDGAAFFLRRTYSIGLEAIEGGVINRQRPVARAANALNLRPLSARLC
ncbi:hypothetical protein AC629_39830 [Bradyrhizobium sp. NAS80.1]|uniref:hypothetical protein n=1 Tax=Bradyrhizobium sp. NAS80.1 TaxID=1680159 RepID=UPI000965C633|nr:hypothetical protein [Bradyrhizobium sp. NAS80.1]OKO70963.1 hypothetical protein AC629_39830 [Bradyrhizobium sp. NAS80.1]